MKHIGKKFEYYTNQGNKYTAVCQKIEFDKLLGKPLFTGVSPYGNTVKLTKDEIHRFIN